MRRSGFKLLVSLLAVSVAIVCTACASITQQGCRQYSEKDMTQLSTFVRVTMDIVNAEYMGKGTPEVLTEGEIKSLVEKRGTPFEELKLLDQYELQFVSYEGNFAAVAWDPENSQKLLQDLRCTPKLDDASWKSCVHGSEFTLGWEACN